MPLPKKTLWKSRNGRIQYREIIEKINDADRLQMLTIELSIASTQEQAKDLLLSFVSAA